MSPPLAIDVHELTKRFGQRTVVESLHVDVCTHLPLFGNGQAPAPGAERAATAIQLPVYASLSTDAVRRIAAVVAESVTPT